MEMPMGWKRMHWLMESNQSPFEFKFGIELLDLMKKMAEVIEWSKSDCLKKDCETCNVDLCVARRDILNKFKEWK